MTSSYAAIIAAGCAIEVGARLWRGSVVVQTRDLAYSLRSGGQPCAVHRRIEDALHAACIGMPAATVVRLWLSCAAAALLVCIPVGINFALGAASIVVAAGPVWVFARRHRRRGVMEEAMPELLRGVALELRGGVPIAAALRSLSERDGECAQDLRRLVHRVERGATLTDALRRWKREVAVADAGVVCAALSCADLVGGSSADSLDGIAAALEARHAAIADVRVHSAQARTSAIVMLAAPFGYLAFASLLDRNTVAILVGTTFGRICVVAATVLDGLAWLWIRFLVRERPTA